MPLSVQCSDSGLPLVLQHQKVDSWFLLAVARAFFLLPRGTGSLHLYSWSKTL